MLRKLQKSDDNTNSVPHYSNVDKRKATLISVEKPKGCFYNIFPFWVQNCEFNNRFTIW